MIVAELATGGPAASNRKDALLAFSVLFAALLPFALAPLRAQALGPDGRGAFAYFQSSFTIVAAMSALGLRHAFYRHVRQHARRFGIGGAKLWLTTSALSVTIGVSLACVALVSVSTIVGVALLIVSMAGPLFAITQIETANAQMSTQRARVAVLATSSPLVELIGNIIMLIAHQLTVFSAVAITTTAELARGASALVLRAGDRRSGERTRPDRVLTGEVMASAWRLAPATLVPLLASNIDIIIYGMFAPLNDTGVYAVAKIGTSLFILAAMTLEGSFLNRMQARRIDRLLLLSCGLAGSLWAVGSVVGAITIVPLFGSDFAGAASAFPLTAGAGALGAVYVWCSAACAREGRGSASLVSAVVVLVLIAVGSCLVSVVSDESAAMMSVPLVVAYGAGAAITAGALLRGKRS